MVQYQVPYSISYPQTSKSWKFEPRTLRNAKRVTRPNFPSTGTEYLSYYSSFLLRHIAREPLRKFFKKRIVRSSLISNVNNSCPLISKIIIYYYVIDITQESMYVGMDQPGKVRLPLLLVVS